MWAAVHENGDFGTCGSNNWETVADRWVHAARGLASTKLSFHLCNVLRDCHRGVPGKNINCWNLIIHNVAGLLEPTVVSNRQSCSLLKNINLSRFQV